MISIIRVIIGGVVGAGIGFAMYKFVGCRTGACPLTGNPWIAMSIWGIAGALMGAGKL
jgi:hypothetical protein